MRAFDTRDPLRLGRAVKGYCRIGGLFCARGAQQQASQEEQAGGGRNEKGERGCHGKDYIRNRRLAATGSGDLRCFGAIVAARGMRSISHLMREGTSIGGDASPQGVTY